MGRVYDVRPDVSRGERPGKNVTVVALDGPSAGAVRYVTRVEFDADADEGPAAVTTLVTDLNGRFVVGPDGRAARASFRCVARVVPPTPAAADADTPFVVGA